MVNSVSELITALGGVSKVAALVGLRPSAVSNWKTEGFVPSRHFFEFTEELERRGFEVDPRVFGFRGRE